MTNSDIQFYLKELQSEECFCGRDKQKGWSFCYRCYSWLPREMQRDLHRHIADGYGEAYDGAVVWLDG